MNTAANCDSLDKTVYYSNQALFMLLAAIVIELKNLREVVAQKT